MKRLRLLVIVILAIAGGTYLVLANRPSAAIKPVAPSGCVARQFAPGSSGACVSDIQTMVNFMETDGLTECPFTGAKTLAITGMYDTTTQYQVKTVQTWNNCYNKQEGSSSVIAANGIVGTSTWSELCTYAYQYQKQVAESTSPYLKASVAAGKNAGC